MSLSVDKKRCDQFWARQESDRPLLSAWIGTFDIAELYPNAMSSLPTGQLNPQDLDLSCLALDYKNLYEINARTCSDIPWAAFPIMTLPWVEAIMGCPIYHRDGNIWAGHWLECYEQLDDFRLNADNPWLIKLLEFTEWLVALFKGRAPVSNSLMRGPLDLLSALRGPEQMVLDLFDHPEEVHKSLQRLTDIWIYIAHAQQSLIPDYAGGYAFGQIYLWGRERGGWFQDDALSLWSPKYYRKYLLPQESRLAGCLPLTGIHLHPGGLYAVDDLVQIPELDIIEINYDIGGPPLTSFISTLQNAIRDKRLVLWGAYTDQELQLLAQSLPCRGFALQIIAPTPEAFQQKADLIRKIWQEAV